MKNKIHLAIYIVISGFFLFTDQLFKYFAKANPNFSLYVWKSWIGWEYFANTGVAFSLPVPNWLVVIVTPMILGGLVYWFIKSYYHIPHAKYHISLALVIAGAISNYIDRLFFGATIDYLRIFTGVINLADVMIVGGVGILVFASREK